MAEIDPFRLLYLPFQYPSCSQGCGYCDARAREAMAPDLPPRCLQPQPEGKFGVGRAGDTAFSLLQIGLAHLMR